MLATPNRTATADSVREVAFPDVTNMQSVPKTTGLLGEQEDEENVPFNVGRIRRQGLVNM